MMQRRKFLNSVWFHGAAAGLGLVMIYPILWLAASSLKPEEEIWRTVSSIIPQSVTLEHYISGWKGFGGISFTTFYRNSFLYAGLGTLGAVATSAIVAFGFARIPFRGKALWFTAMLMTLMLPIQIQVIPQYVFFTYLGWINSFIPLLLPRFLGQAGQAFFIFMIVQFIRTIPYELDEAAYMDGVTRFGVFRRIMLPLVKPALVTSGIFSFYWTWGDFLTPLIYLNSPRLYTVSVALRSFSDPSGNTDWGAIFAMSFLSLIPVLIVFFLFQKYIVEGISTTGMKG
jgi:multiple sugar transport system permease protein